MNALTQHHIDALRAVANGSVTFCDANTPNATSYKALYQQGLIRAYGIVGTTGLALLQMRVTDDGRWQSLRPREKVAIRVKAPLSWPWGKVGALVAFIATCWAKLT